MEPNWSPDALEALDTIGSVIGRGSIRDGGLCGYYFYEDAAGLRALAAGLVEIAEWIEANPGKDWRQ